MASTMAGALRGDRKSALDILSARAGWPDELVEAARLLTVALEASQGWGRLACTDPSRPYVDVSRGLPAAAPSSGLLSLPGAVAMAYWRWSDSTGERERRMVVAVLVGGVTILDAARACGAAQVTVSKTVRASCERFMEMLVRSRRREAEKGGLTAR